jgi:hypothetical protein
VRTILLTAIISDSEKTSLIAAGEAVRRSPDRGELLTRRACARSADGARKRIAHAATTPRTPIPRQEQRVNRNGF